MYRFFSQEFFNCRFLSLLGPFNIGEAANTECLRIIDQIVHLIARPRCTAGDTESRHDTAACDVFSKDFESGLSDEIVEAGKLHSEAEIGFIVAVRFHCLFVGQARERGFNLDSLDLAEEISHNSFRHGLNVAFIGEGHFHVDLGEFRLAVCAQIFITETLHNLEIPVETGHHQNLLVLLGRLRQSVEFSRMDSAGNEIVTRTFRRAFHQHRRFDFHKTLRVKIPARNLIHAVAHDKIVHHRCTAQIQITVFQAEIFIGFHCIFNRERRRVGTIENRKFLAENVDKAGWNFRIIRTFRTARNLACY